MMQRPSLVGSFNLADLVYESGHYQRQVQKRSEAIVVKSMILIDLVPPYTNHPPTAEIVSKLGLLSIFVRVSSCDFVDRLYKRNDPRNYTN
jgi:hypothetical protein